MKLIGAEVFDALAILAAEIDVASRRQAIVERNELERRPEVDRPVGAILVGRNVIVDYEMIGRRSILDQTAGYKYWVLSYCGRRGKVLSCCGRSGEAEQCERDARARGLTAPGQADPSLRLGLLAHRRNLPGRGGSGDRSRVLGRRRPHRRAPALRARRHWGPLGGANPKFRLGGS